MSFPQRALKLASLAVSGLLAGVGLLVPSAAAGAATDWNPEPSYTSTDAGDGTYTVPVLNSDVPDVSVERVPAAENDEGRDIYYMISTTMQLSPGAPIMKSYDLVNWEIVNYVFDRMDIGDAYSLRNGASSYGQGQWASSLRFHDGTYYVLVNSLNLGGAFIYRTDDIENGAWERTSLGRSLHDPSLFFDDAHGGTPYILYGGVNAARLNPTLTAIEQDFADIIPRSEYADESYVGSTGLFEGAQAFYIDGYYYVVMITWPSSGRQVAMFRSSELLGRLAETPAPYESRGVLNSNGFAQGSLVPVADSAGNDTWQGFFFRDTFPIGRIPALIPATWADGWPTFGDGGVVPVNGSFPKPIRLTPEQERFERQKSVVASDDFRNDAPHRAYQDQQWQIPEGPQLDQSLIGVELLSNPGAESGTDGWIVNDTATLTPTDAAHGGASALAVTGRTTTGSGPAQDITGRLQHGVTYDVSAWVKYDDPESPATKPFYITARFGGASTTYKNLTSATTLTRGQWGLVSGSFTVPDSQTLADVRVFVETPWTADPAAAPKEHLMDFTIDDASLVGHPVATEAPDPAEIAPNGSNLDLVWEWNHAPDNRYWSLTDRDGWLRLTNGRVVTGAYSHRSGGELTWLEEARNTLSQRTFGPRQSVETTLDVSGMKDGDVAGLAAYNRDFSYIAVKRIDGVNTVGVVHRGQPFSATIDQAAVESFLPGRSAVLGDTAQVHLKADLDFASSPGRLYTAFSYSLDGITWTALGGPVGPLSLDGSLTHFMGHRVGLFSYATQQTGGHVDFDEFLLSDTLTAQDRPLDESALDAAIAHARSLDASEYPADAWASMQDALAQAETATASTFGTQNQIDAPERALSYQLARLGTLREAPAALDLVVSTGSRCVANKVQLVVSVRNADAVPAEVAIDTPFGAKTVDLEPGKTISLPFAVRSSALAAGEVQVTGSAGDRTYSASAPYLARSCG
ncbi:Endo-1,4-beta-xylanase A precursor [Microbacterium hydrocarbonoxydans]|uniref:Endo-1,4-beta-xylanase A n=1 Tax=Microbacterium hydrocarbonoxydans TaxID=273678 RepID=A0A0M2HPN9_9MICO|nr:carbohydrate binding domain-containing protein [Microbacterium hydrocarbonoxydans]KJL48676.1 Endo-1,4-beta-xylanase A precursor [Microbacterium hydrocarbonoxydans]